MLEELSKTREQIPMEKKGFTEVGKYRVFNHNEAQDINELYTSSDSFIDNKSHLAYIDTTIVDARNLSSKSLYSNLSDYRQASIYERKKTNEAIKIDLEKAYLKDPRKATGEAINEILKNLQLEYELKDEDIEPFKSFKDGERGEEIRQNTIFHLQKKLTNADTKLLKGLQTCDYLLTTLSKVEESNRHTISYQMKQSMDKIINNQFKNALGIDTLPYEAKKDIYAYIKKFDENKDSPDYDIKYKKLIDNIKDLVSPYYASSDIDKDSIEKNLSLNVSTLAKSLFAVKDINEEYNSYIDFGSSLNAKVKFSKDFVSLHEMFKRAYAITSLQNGYKKDAEAIKLSNDFKLYFGANKETYENMINNQKLSESEKKSLTHTFNLISSGAFATELTTKELGTFTSRYLNQALTDGVNSVIDSELPNVSLEKQKKIKSIIANKLIEAGNKYYTALHDNDTEFSRSTVNSIYNTFQKETMSSILNEVAFASSYETDILKQQYKETLNDEVINAKTSTDLGDKTFYNRDEIVEIMNFNAINSNPTIKNQIGVDDIEKIASQSLKNTGLRDFAKDIQNKRLNSMDVSSRKGLPIDEEIRNLATTKYDNLTNALLTQNLNKLFFARDTFTSFSNCVQGSSLLKTGVETRMSNLSSCVTKLTQDVENDAKTLSQQVSQSLEGVGALNPFAHLLQLTAITRRLSANNLKRILNEQSREINKIALEVASAHSDIERRARINIIGAEDNSNIRMTVVHDLEKNAMISKTKQEYVSKELVKLHAEKGLKADKEHTVVSKILNDYNIPKSTRLQRNTLNLSMLKSILQDVHINADEIKSYDDLLQNNQISKDDLDKVNFKIDEINFSNMKLDNEKHNTLNYDSLNINDAIERIDMLQKKITEIKLYSQDKISALDFEIKFDKTNPTKQEEILKNWAIENNVTQKEFNTAISKYFLNDSKDTSLKRKIEKGIENNFVDLSKDELKMMLDNSAEGLEQDKLTLTYDLITTSLEEAKQILIADEQKLIEAKNEFSTLDKIFGIYDEIPKNLSDDELKKFERYRNLKTEIIELEDKLNHSMRPREKIEKVINEIKNIFNNDSESTALEQRNVLSNALNILSDSASHSQIIEGLYNHSSVEVDVSKIDSNSNMNSLGIAVGEKAYMLKVNIDTRNNQKRYESSEDRTYFETLDFVSDRELVNETNELGTETSFGTWTDVLNSSLDYIKNSPNNLANVIKEKNNISQILTDRSHAEFAKKTL